MRLEGRDVISIRDFSREEIDYILTITDIMEPMAKGGSDLLDSKLIGTLFFEPSTRTRLSFESAIRRLGGYAVGFAEPRTSSAEKGENLADTARVVENYVDLIVVRHSLEGAARMMAEFASVPVINAGSGAEEHPTQAMLDLYTIKRELGSIDNLDVALVGDLRYGRTVHSLAYALSLYDVNLYLVSPEVLSMRREILDEIRGRIHVQEMSDLKQILPNLDVLYMTRIQRERFVDLAEYEKVKGSYRLTAEDVARTRERCVVMHPLPRVDEIDFSVDSTSHAKYFKQAWYGLLLRMAILSLIFGAIR